MKEVRVETFHVGDDIPDSSLVRLVNMTATTSVNEYPKGGIVVANIDGKPIVALAMGPNTRSERVCEIRKITTEVSDLEVVAKALGAIARRVKRSASLLYDGVLVDEERLSVPEGVNLHDAGIQTMAFQGMTEGELFAATGMARS